MAAPQTYEELQAALQDRLDTLATGQQRIARLLLTDPDGTAFRSVSETAKLAEVHQSSVVRFASLFDLQGYPSLVALCRQHLAHEAQLVSRFGLAQAHSDTELLRSIAEHDQQNILHTFRRISVVQWTDTIELLATADRIHVMGLRKCLPVAQLLAYLLRLVRPGVHQIAPVVGALVDELRDLREDDVFVAISIHRYTAETVQAFEEAKRRGTRTIAFTDTAASPLARIADITFLVDCEGVTILRSVSSFISLAQALATGVAVRNGTKSREQFLTEEELFSSFSVYTAPSGA